MAPEVGVISNRLCFWVLLMQELEVEKFITHEVSLADINKAFDYMLGGVGLRCIIKMDG